jgi:hypothetical protein
MQEQRVAILRQLPSVDGLAQACQQGNGGGAPASLLLEATRGVLEGKRRQILSAVSAEELSGIDVHP